MSKPVEIPEAIERELTLAHADVCYCGGPPAKGKDPCEAIRTILRREIAKAILLKAADVFDQCGWWKMAEENRKQAAALGEES